MEILHVEERGELDIPIAGLISGDRLAIYRAVQEKQYVDARIRNGRIRLIAGKYVGVIPLNSQYAINVRPKVPLKNLVSLLVIAQEHPEYLPDLHRLYREGSQPDIFNLL